MPTKLRLSVLLATAAFVSPCFASDGDAKSDPSEDGPVIQAIRNGKPIIDVRYRLETQENAGFAERAVANTVRTRLGFETGEIHHFKLLFEFENVFSIGADDFNSTTNGNTQFPVVADPDATEINRAQVTFTGIEKTPITVGRQKFDLLNQRFVGAVDFRQNQQTFDAVRLNSTIIEALSFDYLYLSRIHKIFGDDNPLGEIDSNSHVIAATYDAKNLGALSAYGVLLDFEETPAASSATWGVRYQNSFAIDSEAGVKIGVVGEYASQRDYANNPFDYQEAYLHGEATLAVSSVTGKVSYESLGGNGTIAFSTPLATLHKFQGFADVFLNTPATGIEDIYGTLSYSWNDGDGPFGFPVTLYATYHDFESELGSADFGDEIDAGLNVKFSQHWSAEAKGAVYNGDGAFADRSLIWASLRFQY